MGRLGYTLGLIVVSLFTYLTIIKPELAVVSQAMTNMADTLNRGGR